MNISKTSLDLSEKFKKSAAIIRWPVELTGRNSVAPSIMPNKKATHSKYKSILRLYANRYTF